MGMDSFQEALQLEVELLEKLLICIIAERHAIESLHLPDLIKEIQKKENLTIYFQQSNFLKKLGQETKTVNQYKTAHSDLWQAFTRLLTKIKQENTLNGILIRNCSRHTEKIINILYDVVPSPLYSAEANIYENTLSRGIGKA